MGFSCSLLSLTVASPVGVGWQVFLKEENGTRHLELCNNIMETVCFSFDNNMANSFIIVTEHDVVCDTTF